MTRFIIFISCLLVLSGCIQVQPPQISHQDTRINIVSTDKLKLDSKFGISNPNPIGLHGAVDYEILIDGKPFTSGTTSTIDLPASGQTTFNVITNVDLIQVFGTAANILKIIGEGKSSIPYAINGKFKSDVVGIQVEAPVKASGDIPLPKLSDIKITF